MMSPTSTERSWIGTFLGLIWRVSAKTHSRNIYYYLALLFFIMPHLQWMILRGEVLPCIPPLLAPPLTSRDEQFTKGAHNHARVGSRGASSPARQVVNADLPIGAAGAFQPVEYYRCAIASHPAFTFCNTLIYYIYTVASRLQRKGKR